METLEAFESNISLEQTHYQLFLQISNKSLSYSFFDKQGRKFVGLKHYKFENKTEADLKKTIQNILTDDELLLNEFEKVIIQFESIKTMLVPASLFDSKKLKSYLKYHHDISDADQIGYTELKKAGAFVIFSYPIFIDEIFRKHFENVSFTHHSVPFINNVFLTQQTDVNTYFHVHFANDFFDVLLMNNNNIKLYNSFSYKKYTDVIYFLSNIINVHSLTPEVVKIIISGEIARSSEIIMELEKIFDHIHFERYSQKFQYNPALSALPQSRFVNLLNLSHCEL
jgi:hypothetical protein